MVRALGFRVLVLGLRASVWGENRRGKRRRRRSRRGRGRGRGEERRGAEQEGQALGAPGKASLQAHPYSQLPLGHPGRPSGTLSGRTECESESDVEDACPMLGLCVFDFSKKGPGRGVSLREALLARAQVSGCGGERRGSAKECGRMVLGRMNHLTREKDRKGA